MRIFLFSPQILPLLRVGDAPSFGGAEMDVLMIAQGLVRSGHAVTIAAIGDNSESFFYEGIEVISIQKANPRPHRGNFLKYIFRVFYFFFRQNTDIFFAKPACLETVLMFLAAWLRRTPYYFKLSHDWEADLIDLRDKILFKSWLVSFFRFFLRRSAGVISQNQYQKESLEHIFGIHSIIIYPGRILQKQEPAMKKKSILWMGRIHPMKRPELFIKLAFDFEEGEFVMVGTLNPGFEEFFERVKTLVEGIPNLKFIPGVGPGIKEKLFRESKIFVSTSSAEGFPQVFVEALLCQTPVLSFDVDPDGLLKQTGAGICAEGNWEVFRQSLKKLYLNVDTWSTFSQTAYKVAVLNFDIDKNASRYIDYFVKGI